MALAAANKDRAWEMSARNPSALLRFCSAGACAMVVIGCAQKSLTIPAVSPLLGQPKPFTLFHEPFQQLDPQRWREVEVKGQTQFSIEDLDGSRVLKAHSRAAASILLSPFRFDPKTYRGLSWRWRVDRLLDAEDLTRKSGSDAVARVYVYFDTHGLPWQKRNLDYVWSSTLPVGTIRPSAYAESSMIIVVESGAEHLGTWRTVRRDIPDDYRRCYKEDPPNVLAIGLMTDADSTHSEAVAYYDDIMIVREMLPAQPAEVSP